MKKERNTCIECGGSQICEHNRQRNKTDWDFVFARKALCVHERMQIQQDLCESWMREGPTSYKPLWYRDVGASERRVKELLSVSQSFDPIWVDYEDKTAFFDESEKMLPTPKKRVWYHQTPQILGRTFGFIFRE
jgi:hypothetical protein